MSAMIDVQDQNLWNKYKAFADGKDDSKAGELDDWFDGEEESEEDDDAAPPSPASPDPDDEEDEDQPVASGDDEGEEEEPEAPSAAAPDEEDEEGGTEPGDESEAADGETSDEAGEGDLNEEINVSPAEFDEELAQRISEDALEAGHAAEYTIFSRDFDVIEPLEVDASAEAIKKRLWSDKWLTDLKDETRGMTGVMAKDIERMLAARSQVVRVPGFRSGRLHSAGLHRVMAGDDRVFRRKTEQQSKDVAVGLLCDNSGSMHGQKMKVAMTAAYALSSTLERAAIKHEVLGFTTGHHPEAHREAQAESARTGIEFSRACPIYMPVYKGFEERLTPAIERRFAAAPRMHFMAANVDGESVEYAAARMLKRPEKRKVLLVFSDGQPAADGDIYELQAHLVRTVQTCERVGIETIGIGILSDAVRHFYPKHFVLNRVEDLPGLVMKELKRILTS